MTAARSFSSISRAQNGSNGWHSRASQRYPSSCEPRGLFSPEKRPRGDGRRKKACLPRPPETDATTLRPLRHGGSSRRHRVFEPDLVDAIVHETKESESVASKHIDVAMCTRFVAWPALHDQRVDECRCGVHVHATRRSGNGITGRPVPRNEGESHAPWLTEAPSLIPEECGDAMVDGSSARQRSAPERLDRARDLRRRHVLRCQRRRLWEDSE